MRFSETDLKKRIAGVMKEKRLRHSVGVAVAAEKLANRYGIDPEQAWVAGLVHDFARDLPPERLIALAQQHNLVTHEIELLAPELLNAPVGALLVNQQLGLAGHELLAAIANHTLGSPQMSTMEKIIFLADLIEEGRDFPEVDHLREIVQRDLQEAMLWALDRTINYVIAKRQLLHPRTVETRNAFLIKN